MVDPGRVGKLKDLGWGRGAVLVPSWLTGWRLPHPLPYWSVAEAVGILLIVAGLIPAVHVFVQFVRVRWPFGIWDGMPALIGSQVRM
jgi:hypothetical protein